MSDHTIARLLGRVFNRLAEDMVSWDINLIRSTMLVALDLYKSEVQTGDFYAYQMEADEALEKLGLARLVSHQEAEADGLQEGYIYYHEKGF